MNRIKKFENFLESFRGQGNDSLIENVKEAFHSCFENEDDMPEVSVAKRYVAVMESLIWADSDNEAVQKAKDAAIQCKAVLKSVETLPVGVLSGGHEIYHEYE